MKALAPSTVLQVSPWVIRRQMARIDALVFKPAVETGCKKNPLRNGRTAVPLLAGPNRKRIDHRVQVDRWTLATEPDCCQ